MTVNFDVGKNPPQLIGYHSNVPWTTAKLISQAAQSRQPCVNSHQLSEWKPWEPSYLTPTKSTYLKGSLKDLSQVIMFMTSTAVQNLVEIRPWGASGQIGEILTIFRFLFIPLF